MFSPSALTLTLTLASHVCLITGGNIHLNEDVDLILPAKEEEEEVVLSGGGVELWWWCCQGVSGWTKAQGFRSKQVVDAIIINLAAMITRQDTGTQATP